MLAADEREHEALEQQLPDDPPARGAHGGADGNLPRPVGRARQQQVGDVRAGDEQHEHDGAHHRHEHRPPAAADVPLGERFDADDR